MNFSVQNRGKDGQLFLDKRWVQKMISPYGIEEDFDTNPTAQESLKSEQRRSQKKFGKLVSEWVQPNTGQSLAFFS